MLMNLHKKKWTEGLNVRKFDEHSEGNEKLLKEMVTLAKSYNSTVQDEDKMTKEKLVVHKVGKLDPKKHLEQDVTELMASNVTQHLGSMLDTVTI